MQTSAQQPARLQTEEIYNDSPFSDAARMGHKHGRKRGDRNTYF